ncbi:MAG: RNA methyltransferase [Candidatus Methanomethylophilaceae archaeon]|nr:RNA methyltransferase [Candidatus Methanomethylophilaceae archaeon]
MAHIRIVVVGPKFEGNVGAIARSMANFGLDDLVLVNPCPIGDDAYRRAKHGSDILDDAKVVDTIREAVEGCTLIVGTSGVITSGDKNCARVPLPVRQFAEKVKDYEEPIAILFGREDIGLLQEELEKCDLLVTVPTNDVYPILNLSHAATIVMYELFDGKVNQPAKMEESNKDLLFESFNQLMIEGDYPEHRRHDTEVLFRRMMGRAVVTRYEYNVIMGVFNDAVKKIQGKRGPL